MVLSDFNGAQIVQVYSTEERGGRLNFMIRSPQGEEHTLTFGVERRKGADGGQYYSLIVEGNGKEIACI